jgi:hypothetical protein
MLNMMVLFLIHVDAWNNNSLCKKEWTCGKLDVIYFFLYDNIKQNTLL